MDTHCEVRRSIRKIHEQLVELEKNFNNPLLDPREWFDLADDFNGILESGVAVKLEDFRHQVGKTIDAFLCSISRGVASTSVKHGSIVPSLSLIEKSLKDLGLEGLGPEYTKELRGSFAHLGVVSNPPKTLASD
jgi:hypothetical protein